jgi:hypothetical protein
VACFLCLRFTSTEDVLRLIATYESQLDDSMSMVNNPLAQRPRQEVLNSALLGGVRLGSEAQISLSIWFVRSQGDEEKIGIGPVFVLDL